MWNRISPRDLLETHSGVTQKWDTLLQPVTGSHPSACVEGLPKLFVPCVHDRTRDYVTEECTFFAITAIFVFVNTRLFFSNLVNKKIFHSWQKVLDGNKMRKTLPSMKEKSTQELQIGENSRRSSRESLCHVTLVVLARTFRPSSNCELFQDRFFVDFKLKRTCLESHTVFFYSTI